MIPTYIAQWSSNDVVYNISGKIKLDELKKFLKTWYFKSDFCWVLSY